MVYLWAALCGIGLAFGQVLFKLCADAWRSDGALTSGRVLAYFFGAVSFYGVITVFWIWLLGRAELGRLYPFMALAFAAVPIQSHFVFHEQFSVRYAAGILLIMAGIALAVWREKT